MDDHTQKTDCGKIGREEKPSRLKRLSPFAFETLKEVPLPNLTLPFLVLAFCMVWRAYERNFDFSIQIDKNLASFVDSVRYGRIERPEIFIGGSSANRMSLVESVLTERLGAPASNVAISSGWPRHCHDILRKYDWETERTKILIVDPFIKSLGRLNRNRTNKRGVRFYHDRFLFLKRPGERGYASDPPHEKLDILSAWLPVRASIRTLSENRGNIKRYDFWGPEGSYSERYALHYRERLKKMSKEARLAEQNPPRELFRTLTVHPASEQMIRDLVAYCADRNIFVVLNNPPRWYGEPHAFPRPDTMNHSERRHLALMDELDRLPNCRVISARDFTEICPGEEDETLFFDKGHMTRKGATIYTNWLIDRMLEDPEIVAVLENPKPEPELFAWQYARTARDAVVGYFRESNARKPLFELSKKSEADKKKAKAKKKKKKKKSVSPQEPLTVAAPPDASPVR